MKIGDLVQLTEGGLVGSKYRFRINAVRKTDGAYEFDGLPGQWFNCCYFEPCMALTEREVDISKFKIGDYAQLTATANPDDWHSISQSDRDTLKANRHRLKVERESGRGSAYGITVVGVSCRIGAAWIEPFVLNYDGPCPFVVGDELRLRNNRKLCLEQYAANTPQAAIIDKYGLAAGRVREIDSGGLKPNNCIVRAFNDDIMLDWRRFEYAGDQATPIEKPAVAPRKLITDHGYMSYSIADKGPCIYDTGTGSCGAPDHDHATSRNPLGTAKEYDTGIELSNFTKPQRVKLARHETRLWDPYGETDLLCQDSE